MNSVILDPNEQTVLTAIESDKYFGEPDSAQIRQETGLSRDQVSFALTGLLQKKVVRQKEDSYDHCWRYRKR